jgi:carbonic anhydrase
MLLSRKRFSLILSAVLTAGFSIGVQANEHAPAHGVSHVTKPVKVTTPIIDLAAEAKGTKTGSAAHHAVAAKSKPSHAPAGAHKTTAVHWSYEGEGRPEKWGDLDPKFIQCKIGKNQSPINIRDKKSIGTTNLPGFDVHYRTVPMKIIYNGHALQINYPLGSYININDHRYELLQFHFHTPSEHQKEGFNYPMEMHIVHKDGDGNLAVIGILFQEGAENEALQDIITHLPKDTGKQHLHKLVSVNPADFFPQSKLFYKYSGSLTTPPCSEGVYWMVFKQPVEASAEQLEAMKILMGENNRPVQPHYARDVLKSWAEMPRQEMIFSY